MGAQVSSGREAGPGRCGAAVRIRGGLHPGSLLCLGLSRLSCARGELIPPGAAPAHTSPPTPRRNHNTYHLI